MEKFVCTKNVSLSDIGQNFKITNRGFLNILQEAANLASSSVGHGVDDIERTGTTWILLYWRLKIFKRAKYNDTLTIKTWASFARKIYSIRSFEVYNENNELIAVADSKWVFVDATSHSILKIPDELIDIYKPIDEKLFDNELKDKFKLPENISENYCYTTMKRDLDANHHVNNVSFLDIALEALPDDLINNDFKNINIVYKKELHYKDTVSCYYKNEDNKHFVYLYTKESSTLNGVVIFK